MINLNKLLIIATVLTILLTSVQANQTTSVKVCIDVLESSKGVQQAILNLHRSSFMQQVKLVDEQDHTFTLRPTCRCSLLCVERAIFVVPHKEMNKRAGGGETTFGNVVI